MFYITGDTHGDFSRYIEFAARMQPTEKDTMIVLGDAGLKRMRFHDLRHSCASLLLANGVPLKQIQEWLGHSDFSTTANIYAHLDYSSKLSSAQAMESGIFLPGADDFGSKWAKTNENKV